MKKLVIGLSLIGACLLTSCDNEWSWWKEKNVTIEKYISRKEAEEAFDNSATNYKVVDTTVTKEKYNTYYKDYLGKFSTEVDSNITSSKQTTAKKFTNNVVVANEKSDYQISYLNARAVDKKETDAFAIFYPEADSLFIRSVTTREKNKDVEDTYIDVDEDMYDSMYNLGSQLSSSSILWDNVTYGKAKNDQIIIETMYTANDDYLVHFNGRTISCVINRYTLYRFNTFQGEDGSTQYYMDYTYTKIETMTGTDLNGGALSEPYLLEKKESSINYQIKNLQAFDLNNLPEIPE